MRGVRIVLACYDGGASCKHRQNNRTHGDHRVKHIHHPSIQTQLFLTILEGNIPSLTTDYFQSVNLLVFTQGPSNRAFEQRSRDSLAT